MHCVIMVFHLLISSAVIGGYQVGQGNFTRINSRGLTCPFFHLHYSDVIMNAMASQMTSGTIVYWTVVYSAVYSGADQRTHQSSAPRQDFVRAIQWWRGNSPHKWPVTRKMFPFDGVIMRICEVSVYRMINECMYKYVCVCVCAYSTIHKHFSIDCHISTFVMCPLKNSTSKCWITCN